MPSLKHRSKPRKPHRRETPLRWLLHPHCQNWCEQGEHLGDEDAPEARAKQYGGNCRERLPRIGGFGDDGRFKHEPCGRREHCHDQASADEAQATRLQPRCFPAIRLHRARRDDSQEQRRAETRQQSGDERSAHQREGQPPAPQLERWPIDGHDYFVTLKLKLPLVLWVSVEVARQVTV